MAESNYSMFRGKCRKFCEEAIKEDPTLKIVRGHYYCYVWNTNEPHWWTTREDGSIHDPTKLQFPSEGNGTYTPFNGKVNCSECGIELNEEDAQFDSNYCFCSGTCQGRFVGVY